MRNVANTSDSPDNRLGLVCEPRQKNRPGLGTGWGETRESRVTATTFRRASATQPFAVAAIYYDDPPGILAMAHSVAPKRRWPVLSAPTSGLLSVALRDENGRLLPGLIVGDRWFVVGEKGRRYSIVVRNRSDLSLEVVLSVDGLDVLDGRAASFRKRGYVISSARTGNCGGLSAEHRSGGGISLQLRPRVLRESKIRRDAKRRRHWNRRLQ